MLKILYLLYADALSAMRIGLNLFPNLKRFVHAHAFLLYTPNKPAAHLCRCVYTSCLF